MQSDAEAEMQSDDELEMQSDDELEVKVDRPRARPMKRRDVANNKQASHEPLSSSASFSSVRPASRPAVELVLFVLLLVQPFN